MMTSGARLLLVDDNDLLLCSMKRFFSRTFGNVTAVCTGEDALIHLQHDPYHIAVLDVNLPGIDGWEVLSKIMERSPRTRVVIISSSGGRRVKARALDLGAAAFLEKPFSLHVLEDLIGEINPFREREQRVRRAFEVQFGNGARGLTRDMSLTGIFVSAEAPADRLSHVNMLLFPPDAEPIPLKGCVVRTDELSCGVLSGTADDRIDGVASYGLGIKLLDHPDTYRSLISSLLS